MKFLKILIKQLLIFKLNKKHSRNNKLTFNDAVNYFFNYCLINSTKSNIFALRKV